MVPLGPLSKGRRRPVDVGIMLLLVVVMLANAWIVDDAYITFRTVDNFVHGLGLTWNPGERVQVYTHPLWMMVVTVFYMITSELFFTVIVLSAILSSLSVLIAWSTVVAGDRADRWRGLLLILAILSSKSIVDYASSGLESPLSYLIASFFLYNLLPACTNRKGDKKQVAVLFFLASLAFLNRADTILLYLPALCWALYESRSAGKRSLGRMILLATLPATIWVLFSIFYYGYPLPNTAYAKVLATGYPVAWRLQRGLEYMANSVVWDVASYLIFGSAVWMSLKRRAPAAIAIMAGVVLYLIFVVFSGASATHMSGRFCAVPLFMATIVFVQGLSTSRQGRIMGYCLVAYIVLCPISAIKFGTPIYLPYTQNHNYIDTKWHVANDGVALINWRPGKKMPDNNWYRYGTGVGQLDRKVHVGGAFKGEAIGYAGFAAGPGCHFIDRLGLGDPLLARLPAFRPPSINQWKSGHFHRRIPHGYVKSVASGENMVDEVGVKRYYDHVRMITREPLFSWDRIKVIINMNLGRYRHLVRDY